VTFSKEEKSSNCVKYNEKEKEAIMEYEKNQQKDLCSGSRAEVFKLFLLGKQITYKFTASTELDIIEKTVTMKFKYKRPKNKKKKV
jgi:hypothetical protein